LDVSKLVVDEDIYDASVRILLQIINNLDNKTDITMLIGHNPAISYLGDYLTSENTEYLDTATLLVLDFEGLSWSEITEKSGGVVAYLIAKDLK
jgi:phosphohistidine phosphatase